MKPMKHDGQTPCLDDLDRVLDATLAKYASVEPRTGLEDRVLTHLRSGSLRPTRHFWLKWGLAGAMAAIAVVAVLAWRSSGVTHHVIANHPPTTIQAPSIQGPTPTRSAKNEVSVAKHASVRNPAARRAIASTSVAAYPKLEQFPSPQPLSPEEIALAQYVKNFPKEAQLVAHAQEEFALETEKVMNDAGSESRPSASIQQER